MANIPDPQTTAPTDTCLTPEKKTELLAQVKKLSEDTLSIDASFDDISRRLANLREANIPDKFVTDIQRLSTAWEGLHSTYSDLLWQSRDVAGDARVSADDFSQIFISEVLMNSQVSLIEKQAAIQEYRETTEKDKKKAMDMVDGFKRLGNRVDVFCKDWEDIIQHNHLHRFFWRHRHCEEQIAELTTTVRSMKVKIVAMSLAVGVVAVAAGVLALFFVIDGNAEALGTAGVGTIILTRSPLSVINSILPQLLAIPADLMFKGLRTQIADRKSKVEKIEKLKVERDSDEGGLRDIKNIVSKLNGIASVWSCITADLKEIEGQIRNATLNTQHQEYWRAAFNKRLATIQENYANLGEIFREYQIAVNLDHIKAAKQPAS
ncbi:hypothetical protein QCA50_013561 [Cerrena zonata]|uniref:Uncharacterized protein n=1 Tax=Cerrena zonata TaxID=2478898 RepID=A0AAW0FW40_9APHY